VADLPPRFATSFVGGSASPGLFDLFLMMSDCPKHACHIKARGPTGHDEECALQSLGIAMTRKIVESVRFETLPENNYSGMPIAISFTLGPSPQASQ